MGWTTVPLRKLVTPTSARNRTDLPLLSVAREKGVIIRTPEGDNHNAIPEDLSNYKAVLRGQFVINKMKAWQGSYGVSMFDGIVSPAYFVFHLHIDNPRFFNYAIRSHHYIYEFGRISKGVRVGQWDLDLQQLKYIPFLLPSRSEQDQIVRYLDWKTSQINRLLKKLCGRAHVEPKDLERYPYSFISLLVEYRTRLVSDIVTGKLDVRNVTAPDYEIARETQAENEDPEQAGDEEHMEE